MIVWATTFWTIWAPLSFGNIVACLVLLHSAISEDVGWFSEIRTPTVVFTTTFFSTFGTFATRSRILVVIIIIIIPSPAFV